MIKLVLSTTCGMIGAFILAIWICWGAFIMAMSLKRAQEAKKLNFWTKLLGYPFIAIFLAIDFVFNMIFGSILFVKYPQDLLFTQRLDRYIHRTGWRRTLAVGICQALLDSFDPDGKHCSL